MNAPAPVVDYLVWLAEVGRRPDGQPPTAVELEETRLLIQRNRAEWSWVPVLYPWLFRHGAYVSEVS